ncbi:phage tail protein [Microbacterium resistens]|uniref:Phage tail protein n=1 Tax=Microbacterium resistens TaxID=156977 RepID=A0ABY3RTN9_9MICO|nr:phage tail protein [Microbacterium resistens]UGS26318.1 phage tail protein [Microbacterium resistens]
MGWNDRLSWSGETPLTYPGLNPVAAQRFDGGNLAAGTFPDAVNPARSWSVTYESGSGYGVPAGDWGTQLALNVADPETEQGRLRLPHFAGLWPSSGRLLIGLRVRQGYAMAYCPLMSTRGGSSPVVYLSTYQGGSVRQQVYDGSGDLVLDEYDTPAWAGTTGWQWIGQLVDLDARTSQLAVVRHETGELFVGPALSLSGAVNAASTADLDVLSLQTAGYWTGGHVDEVFVAHPTAAFDFAAFARRIAHASWARGASAAAAGKLTVSDAAVTATAAHTLATGAEPVSWTAAPAPTIQATPHWSADGGATWSTGALPAQFTGLLRWEVPLAAGARFTGIDLLPPEPTLAPIPNQTVNQQETLTIPLDATWAGADPEWTVAAVGVTATITGTTLTIAAGWASGDVPVTVTLRDEWGRSVSRTFTVTVAPLPWTPPPIPQYPRAPIIVHDGAGDTAIIDPRSAVVIDEVNGEQALEFSLPAAHRATGSILPERVVELAGEKYRVRRITTSRQGRVPVVNVRCEAEFYDLAYAGQIDGHDYLQTPAGRAMQDALRDTGWRVGAVTVTTRRTYAVEDTNPLEMLRTIQKHHGGDLVFDSTARTVSLVTQAGRDRGVAFLYGRGLTESKRVVDTTSLVTRIYARNADGQTIAAVNNGKPYVEDFTWTSEVREATYDFAAGTSPWTMLAMTQATLAKRCKPSVSYEFTVADLSYKSGQAVDRFAVGDLVTVVDDELGIREAQRIVRVEHDVVRPWASKITLSAKLRELGGATDGDDGGLNTGSPFAAFDLVPFNLLRNGRFDNALSHWASSGVSLVPGRGTGDNAVRFAGAGLRWIEQTVHPDNRDVYALSLRADAVSGGSVPPLKALVTVEYEDGTSETIPVELA